MSDHGYWRRTAGRRLSRRGVLRGSAVAGLGLAGAALIGCGDDDDDEAAAPAARATAAAPAPGAPAAPKESGAPAEEQINRGGSYAKGYRRSIKGHFDPHINLNDQLQFWNLIGSYGTDQSQDGTEIIPEALESWEIPGDGTEVIAKVRANMNWHDKPPVNARAVDAEDAVFNLLDIAALLRPDRASEFHSRSLMAGLVGAEAIDEKTLSIKFAHPVSTFFAGLSHFRAQWSPRDFESGGGDFTDGQSLVGSGPWVIDKFVPDQRLVMKANPDYWKTGQPYFDEWETKFVPDANSEITAFSQGEIQTVVGSNKVGRQTIEKLEPDAHQRIWDFPSWIHLRFQVNRKPFDDVRVRRAIFLAMDYHKMMGQFFGEGFWRLAGAMSTAYPEAYQPEDLALMPGWNPDTKEQDIQDAIALMTAAGFPDGEIEFGITHYGTGSYIDEDALRAQGQLKAVWPKMGANLNKLPDAPSFGKKQAAGDFDTISYTIHGVPDGVLEIISDFGTQGTQGGTGGGRNYGRFSDAESDALMDKAVRELDREERTVIMRTLQDRLIALMPTIGLGSDKAVHYFRPEVRGWEWYGSALAAGSRATDAHADKLWFAET